MTENKQGALGQAGASAEGHGAGYVLKCAGKAVAFLGIALLIMLVLSPVFAPKSNHPDKGIHLGRARGVLYEPKDSIDVIILGDSETYRSFVPMNAWKQYGFTSYICGSSGQRIYHTYTILKEALEVQHPRVVAIESGCIFRTRGLQEDLATVAMDKVGEKIPFVEYHDRWKELSLSDFTDTSFKTEWTSTMKGYRLNKDVEAYKGVEDYMSVEHNPRAIWPLQQYYAQKIVELCQEKGIPVLIYTNPSPVISNKARHKSMSELTQKLGVPYWDLNETVSEIGIDWKADTFDAGDHMNYYGAVKLTEYLAGKLDEAYELPDHQGDEYYKEAWDDKYDKFVEMIEENKEE